MTETYKAARQGRRLFLSSVLIPLRIIPSYWNPVGGASGWGCGGVKSTEERFWLSRSALLNEFDQAVCNLLLAVIAKTNRDTPCTLTQWQTYGFNSLVWLQKSLEFFGNLWVILTANRNQQHVSLKRINTVCFLVQNSQFRSVPDNKTLPVFDLWLMFVLLRLSSSALLQVVERKPAGTFRWWRDV